MKKITKYFAVAGVELKNALIYRAQAFGGLIFYPVILFVFFCLWRAIYTQRDLAGYTLNQIVWYLCITELIAFGMSPRVFARMNEEVKSGAVAYQLGRPYHYVFYQYALSMGAMVFSFLVYLIAAIIIGMVFVGPLIGFAWLGAPLMLLMIFMGASIQFFLQMALGLTAFYAEENGGFFFVYQKFVFMLGMFLPVEFLPDWLERIAKCLPFSYVCWAPARMVVAFDAAECGRLISMQALWLAFAVCCALTMFELGKRHIGANGG